MKSRTAMNITAEVAGARAKFPTNQHKLAALTEELGELAQALIDHSRGKASPLDVYTEAMQVAAMAVRIAEEGDASFPYRYDPELAEWFLATGERRAS